ncbi:hypothetical protein AB0I39_24875 [Kitasatospora purpeofusca]|uniref:hypothetical protein n=1 Tax=Kitasatospora purpeofusca TaxID=67352 RepID=UPI0033E451C7
MSDSDVIVPDAPAGPTPEAPPAAPPAAAPDAVSVAAPGLPDGHTPAAPSAHRPPRRLLRAGGATVAAALVGVVIGIGIIEVRYDDPAPAAAAPTPASTAAPAPSATATPFGAKSNGNHFGSLRDLLLPVPAGFGPGPDDGGFGNDVELTGEQLLAAELDDEVLPLPKEQQDKLRKYWNDLHVKAAGVRTYTTQAGELTISMKLRQFNQQEVQKLNEYTAIFTGETGIFRTGPTVPGHAEAHCYLMPAPPSAPIDRLECSAGEGDLLVVMAVEGVAPLPKDRIVAFLAQQLDRLAIPGASV